VVHAVRTSVADVDRRLAERHAVDLACRIEGTGQPARAARVADLSVGGARLVEAPELPVGGTWALRLDGLAVALPFKVLESDGTMVRIAFDLDDQTREALQAMLPRISSRQAA
jgi:methyl-accepting chemotaxis protein